MEKNENPMFTAVAAQLGFSEDIAISSVSNRIAELLKAETDLKDVQSKFDALQISFKGKEAEVANLSEKLTEVENSLQKYKDAEAAAHAADIKAMIDQAVADGRIKAEAHAYWTKMADIDFETVKATLESIPTRDKITEAIANDPANVQAAATSMKDTDKELAEKVNAVVGADFKFRKLED